MLRSALVAAAAAVLAACTLDWDQVAQAGDDLPLLSGSTGSSGDATPTTSGASASDATTGAMTTTTLDADETSGTDTAETADGLLTPAIVDIDMPNLVKVAGPAGFTVTTQNATTVYAKLDGVALDALTSEGGGVFVGAVPIFGSKDDGAHVLEVIAENEGLLSDARSVMFDVATPQAGATAWAKYGPAGSSTTALAFTAEDDVIEVGMLEVAGVSRPAIRKRSGLSGDLMWADGTLVIDDRQGSAVGVAVTPDGHLWVAMNVRDGGDAWRAHIVLLDAAGQPTGVALESYYGATVTALASDGEGGFFAVGYVPSGEGDYDVATWRMNRDHIPIFTGQPWDHWPEGWEPHLFTDLAFGVAVQGDVAWIAGTTQGRHNPNKPLVVEARGLIVRINIDTFAVLGPVIIAPEDGVYTQSFHNGIALHPEGALVASQGCDATCTNQRFEVALYSGAGPRLWHETEGFGPVAYGRGVAANKHGRALAAAAMRDGQVLRGRMLGRIIHEGDEPLFDVWFPSSKDSSAAEAVATGAYDQAAWGGYVTAAGVQRAYAVRVHQ